MEATSAGQIAAIVRAEAGKMRAAIDGVSDGAQVSLRVSDFAKLAYMMERLADSVTVRADGSLSESRHWIPLDNFERLRAEATHWQAECEKLRREAQIDSLLRL
ncbi:hypothetical protein EBBID32_32630 [Sphingobium indicum BiD32]|uniref:Uncharacterized protein n=1 Tax=Sphingobium indicum BiD32 TaxID=1301087 RepID=N1MPP0_9SPHN|nr:hypothetical protein [Sphingobium indicum]CCW18906.1 hypothetical protein EBBID32_32630 [Sphingobium indicum BiD32]